MRIICDALGRTYVSSVAQCIAEKKKMAIIFFDWTIEVFPNLLHAPFIHFPLYHKWLKQNLKNKRLWGIIITYCLVAIVHHDMFDKTNFNNVKDQFGHLIPGLFDKYLTRPIFNGTLMDMK